MDKLALEKPTTRTAALFAAVVGTVFLLSARPASADLHYRKDANGVIHYSAGPAAGFRPVSDLSKKKVKAKKQVRSKKKVRKTARKSTTTRRLAATRRALDSSNNSYDHLIAKYSRQYGVNPALVKAVIHAESNFRRTARSHVGARGLMQLMPRTARAYGVKSAADLNDPQTNIRAGVRHLKMLIKMFGPNPKIVAAAYNAGQGNVKRYKGVPPFGETRRYVKKVLRYRARYQREGALASADLNLSGS